MEKIDINNIYDKIVEVLRANDYLDEITSITNTSSGAATGSEALMNQGAYLVRLKHTNPPVYKLIREHIQQYLKYCLQHGLIIYQ